ncbi:MAG: 3'-5' exonuclease [Gemmatimonadetes bacterium]|nr:3'-5' exonuclease [Gammaproteobacteria bacterium]MYG81290.1 3'-5' exonuclease [Gemmatimonadota bacterium]MYI06164.1 3'-5' exonuclease [Gemmatimonadota bacterium]
MTRAESFQKLVAIDVETSGINPFRHQILSLALVPLDISKPPLELYVNEGEPEWQRIAAHYFEESRSAWEADGRSASEACAALSSYIETVFGEQITVVGHNVGFDVAFLRQLAFRAGLDEVPLISHRVIDTHTILYLLHLSGVIPEGALSSDGAFRHFDIRPPASARHTAIGDALATRELFMRVLKLWGRASTIL